MNLCIIKAHLLQKPKSWGCPTLWGAEEISGKDRVAVPPPEMLQPCAPCPAQGCPLPSAEPCTAPAPALPHCTAQHGPPALTHRGGGQRLPSHQLPRAQPVQEVTELTLSSQPCSGEDEPVWDGARDANGAPGAPQPPRCACASSPYVPSELLLLVLPSVDSRLPCRVTLVLSSTAMPVSVLRRMLLRSFLGPPSGSRGVG